MKVLFVFLAVFSGATFAADFPIPDADVAKVLLELATNYKTMGILAIISGLVVVSVQAIKKFVHEQWKYKRLLTLSVSIVYSVISGLLIPGSNVLSVMITVFLASGGAVALYEALKGAGIINSENQIIVDHK